MPRVLGIDPGTESFDVCCLENGRVAWDRVIATGHVAENPHRLRVALEANGPYDLICGPSGYGLPWRRVQEATEEDIALAALVPPGAEGRTGGISGFTQVLRSLATLPWPVVLVPGVIHLASVPRHRKVNRIDLGTADKVCVAALAVAEWTRRTGRPPGDACLILVEVGAAFTAVLGICGGQIVDGLGGSSGPPGFRSGGAMDAEVACWLGRVTKNTVFSGGVYRVAGQDTPDWRAFLESAGDREQGRAVPPSGGTAHRGASLRPPGLEPPAATAAAEVAWHWWVEGIEKAVAAMCVSVPGPREIALSGRLALEEPLLGALQVRLGAYGSAWSLRGQSRAKAAAEGAAVIADGLAGGAYAALVAAMGLREAGGTVLDHLYY